MSHCKILPREDCKTLLNLDHVCILWVFLVFYSLSPRWFFIQGMFAACSTKNLFVVFKKIGLNVTDTEWCFMLTDGQYPHSPTTKASRWPVVRDVKPRPTHKPCHLPSLCPLPSLNQLFSFPLLSLCQNGPNVFLVLPAAKQPARSKVLQKIAIFIQTGFCGVSGFCCSSIVHTGALAVLDRTLSLYHIHLARKWNAEFYSKYLKACARGLEVIRLTN